ncbi:hypothetical protein [Streptomyces cavernicola]|uniref:DUF3592 domain-containing protein n=1 Tax=Streptomyces cavernicola TaxID=3043613 RepID=A0ABT6SIE1_9ACTN|nr:hypothetical protein [Streptomyces sp. B-S-A6]MDI3407960.1 hypothetical protein [Streptomyces sp. B-S-A6]
MLAGALSLVLAVLLFLPLTAWAGYAVANSVDEVRQYRSAPVCVAGDGGDCRHRSTATVRSTEIVDKGKTESYTVLLDGPAQVRGSLSLDDDQPLLARLRPGDTVTVTRWRGNVTQIDRDGVAQQSKDSPESDRGFATGFALAPLTLFLYLGYAGIRLLVPERAPGSSGVAQRVKTAGYFALLVIAAAVLFGLAADGITSPTAAPAAVPALVVALWASLLILLSALALVERRRAKASRSPQPYGPA